MAGRIIQVQYWIEGMDRWEDLTAYPYPAKVGDEIHLAVEWINDSSYSVVGHVLAQLKSPLGYPYQPSAVENQDKPADPNRSWTVTFAPVTLNESGSWEFFGRLDLDGTIVDSKKFTFTVIELIQTTLTISLTQTPPVKPGSSLTFTGKLTRVDTGAGLAGQTFDLEQPPGTKIKSGTTDSAGNYSITVTAPTTIGTYNYRTSFTAVGGYGKAVSRTLGVGVGIVANMWTAIKAWWDGLTRWQKTLVLGISGGTVVASVVLKKK